MSRSLIAGVNALLRAKESARPEGSRIVVDPFAERFVERDLRVRALRLLRYVVPPLRRTIDELQTAHCVRHRAIDELLLRATSDAGVRQVVTLGAGYDMRPYRLRDRARGVRFLELDQRATIDRKLRLLRALHLREQRDVERVAVDLMVTSLQRALAGTAFEPGAPTCFVLEGLIHYLNIDRVHALLSAIRSLCPRPIALLSFIRDDVYLGAHPTFLALVRAVSEIPALSFGDGELERACASHGLAVTARWTLEEQIEAFAPEARGRPRGLGQDVAQIELARAEDPSAHGLP